VGSVCGEAMTAFIGNLQCIHSIHNTEDDGAATGACRFA
jgi:hypothetical protein